MCDSSLNLSLRQFDLSDVDDFMVWATDEKSAHFCSWDTFKSKQDVLKYMEEVVLPHPWFRAICIDDKPIGCVSVTTNTRPSDRCRAEIGYVLGSAHWGKGIATRAVKMVVGEVFAFSEWAELERLEGLVDVENVGSQKVLEKAGFLKEGVLRKYAVMKGRSVDMVMYSVLASDPC
uniref:N-acetyltransferase domain-containing protein n=1 Tax=Kalanchoe fedtschenkoi TaxID=63787 RepID=A0A7N0V718_KALFE